MTKPELLSLLRLLSALESWSFCVGERLPDYLQKKLSAAVEQLENEILRAS